MKRSPLQLDAPAYPVVSVRSTRTTDRSLHHEVLDVRVNSYVIYEGKGNHFAYLSIEQADKKQPYLVDIEVFAGFKIDADGCREAYKQAFNPGVVAVNISRLLYSGARELLAFVTSRGPYGAANLPTLMLGPEDVEISFEEGSFEKVLKDSFGMEKEAIEKLVAQKKESGGALKARSARRPQKKIPASKKS